MNRPLTDVYSAKLSTDRQGELYHRYVLGLYSLLDRLTADFGNVLFEGCASGGGALTPECFIISRRYGAATTATR